MSKPARSQRKRKARRKSSQGGLQAASAVQLDPTASAAFPSAGPAASLSVTQVRHHSGPLPAADEVAKYDAIHPGFALRILEMAEREQEHQHGMSRAALEVTDAMHRRGQWFGLVGVLAVCALAGFIAFSGAPGAAATLGGSTIAILAGAFIISRRRAEIKG